MIFAYADPPYPGQAKKHYSHDPRCGEVDHRDLLARLCAYPMWALSTSTPALREILPLCPPKVRVAAWVKPFCAFKKNVNPAYAWEPVLFVGRSRGAEVATVRDWIDCNITLERGLVGAKPDDFCFWLFDLVGATPADEFLDLYPGSGAVSRAWDQWRQRRSSPYVQTGPLFAEA